MCTALYCKAGFELMAGKKYIAFWVHPGTFYYLLFPYEFQFHKYCTIKVDIIPEKNIEIGWDMINTLVVNSCMLSFSPAFGPNIMILEKKYPSVKAKMAMPIINDQSDSNHVCNRITKMLHVLKNCLFQNLNSSHFYNLPL